MNFGLAWISVFLGIILAAKYIIRVMSQKQTKNQSKYKKLNLVMKKFHILFGILMIISGFLHGVFSSEKILSFNFGTYTLVLCLAVACVWSFRKLFIKRGVWIKYHRVLTLLLLISIIIHVIDVGGIQIFNVLSSGDAYVYQASNDNPKVNVDEINNNLGDVKLKNGTYTGEATGYRPGLILTVEIKNNIIKDIKVTQHNEVNSRFYQRPIQEIPSEIVQSQSLEVDAITGATFTSVGIINAVNDALSKALISGKLPELKQLPVGKGKKH